MDTNPPGCARVGEGREIFRESGGSVRAQTTYAKKTLFAPRRKRGSAWGALAWSPLRVFLFLVNADDAFGDAGKYFPGDRSGFGCEFAGQNFLVTLPAKKNNLIPRFNAA